MYKYTICSLVAAFLFLPAFGEANQRSGGVDTSDLDDDPVESFAIPVLFGVELNGVTPDFGDPRGGGTREHEGQDFIVPLGTPIVSPTEAVVIRTGIGDSAGNYVYTANPGDEIFRYMHLDEIADIERGDELRTGDFIGTVGDTGNAAPGQYHLHFEVRPDNKATDPYPRLTDEFSHKEKATFLRRMLDDIDDEEDYAELLVANFADELTILLNTEYELPDELVEALEDQGIVSQAEQIAKLEEVLTTIPKLLAVELQVGDQGPMVQLLQLYLVFSSTGVARDQLAAAGATGYYGPITSAAVWEYQVVNGLLGTGVYDTKTREHMLE